MQHLILSIVDALIMVMPAIGYIDTNRIMCATKSCAAYNFKTVLVLLSSQYLKILYFIYHPYAIRIFGQSISQLLISLSLTFFKHKYKETKGIHLMPYWKRILTMDNAKDFTEFMTSLGFYYIVTFIAMKILCQIIGNGTTIELVGLIANIIESIVSLPIFYKVVVCKAVKSVSFVLILQYITGDMMKIALFALSKTPWFFVAGGCFQLFIDTILFFVYLKLSMSNKKKDVDEENLIKNEEEEDSEIKTIHSIDNIDDENDFNSSSDGNKYQNDEKFEYNTDV